MQQPIYQHNWTGALALYVTSPAQPLLNPAIVKGVSHNTKGSKGTWLKAASHARLRLVEHEEQHEGQNSITSMLELRLQENLLLQCPLLEQHLSLCIIPSSSTANSGSILAVRTKQQQEQQQQQVGCQRMHAVVGDSNLYVACTASVCMYRCSVPVYMMLSNCEAAASSYHRPCCGCTQPCLPSQQPHLLPHSCNVCSTSCVGCCVLCLLNQRRTACAAAVLQAPVWCFRFYDAPDCSSFKSALQAMLSSMHSRTLQQQREQQQRHQQMLLQALQQQQQQEEAAAVTGPTSAQPQVSIAQHACCLLSCCLVTNSRQQHTFIPSSYTTS
jgi:hypothetical protein